MSLAVNSCTQSQIAPKACDSNSATTKPTTITRSLYRLCSEQVIYCSTFAAFSKVEGASLGSNRRLEATDTGMGRGLLLIPTLLIHLLKWDVGRGVCLEASCTAVCQTSGWILQGGHDGAKLSFLARDDRTLLWGFCGSVDN